MENTNIILMTLDERSIEQQVHVYRSAFEPTSSVEDNISTWRKKHYENPLGKSIIIGAFIGNQLVGMNAYMPVEYFLNGERIKMLQSCESGVLPTCQGKGIWKKVVTYAMNYITQETEYKLVIGFPNYINSYPGFKKMGWATVSDMKNYVMINNLSAIKVLYKKKSGVFRFFVNGIILQRALVNLCVPRKNYYAKIIPVDQMIWNSYKENTLECSHSDVLMRWKAYYKGVKTVGIEHGGRTVATCLYSFSTYNECPIIKLEGFHCMTDFLNKEKQLLSCVLLFFAKAYPEVAFIRVWVQRGTGQDSLFKSLLFACSSHPNPFIINNPQSVYSEMKWSLSFFDLD